MQPASQHIKAAATLGALLFKRQWLPISVLFLISCVLNFSAEDAMRLYGPADESRRWMIQLAIGLWELLDGILVFLLLSWAVPEVRNLSSPRLLPRPFDTAYLGHFFAEYLRVISQILMWGLLLIIPGFFRYVQLVFVTLIALFSSEYRSGQVDALRFSETLMRGQLLRIGLVLGLTLGLQIFLEFIPQMYTPWHNYPVRVILAGLITYINIWTYSWIYLKFEEALHSPLPQEA